MPMLSAKWIKTFNYIHRNFNKSSLKMKQKDEALSVFRYALEHVSPKKMISAAVTKDQTSKAIKIHEEVFSLEKKKLSLIGFGKAVAEMAAALFKIIGDDICQGILSVPLGTVNALTSSSPALLDDQRIRIYEGAENNLPDANSLIAANEIFHFIQKLSVDDLLLVLISGGGSALLPSPIPPITLEEKMNVTRLLANAGATINELNIVRTHLSQLKGGKLAKAAFPARVVALILSDVIGDPLDVIASGPTFLGNFTSPSEALKIIDKYNMRNIFPVSVLSALHKQHSIADVQFENVHLVHNILIGNNKTALKFAQERAQNFGYLPVILSSEVCGEAKYLGDFYAELARLIVTVTCSKALDTMLCEKLKNTAVHHGIKAEKLENVIKTTREYRKIAIISGGETTVKILGRGKGGRNQECTLAFTLELNRMTDIPDECEITFLSAGTDGQDGPTTATGAIAYNGQILEMDRNLVLSYLQINDSHTFFRTFKPDDLIITGATGTNVMDVHILMIDLTRIEI